MTGPQAVNINYDRYAGFKDALKETGRSEIGKPLITNGLEQNDGYEAFVKFLTESQELPEVIMCVNDSLALGVYRACAEHGLEIPKDIAVAGFGNLSVASLVQPSLTTVELDMFNASKKALNNLIDLIDNEGFKLENEYFSGKVILRDSV